MISTGDTLLKKIIIASHVQFQYKLENYTVESLKTITKSLDIARNELLDYISRRDIILPEGREDLVLKELNDLTFGIQEKLTGDIAEATEIAGQASLREYGQIMSFDGRLTDTVGFNFVSLTAEQLRAAVLDVPVGGKLLKDWVAGNFERQIVDEIQTDILAGMFKGEGTSALVNRLRQSFDMLNHEAITLTRTYVASINNRAAEMVYKANSDIIKEEEWSATLEVSTKAGAGTCMQCALLDGQKWPINSDHPRPIAHPRCVTGDSIIFAPDITHLMRSEYSGPIVKITLANGCKLSVTSNHMLMTPNGLVMARFLTDRDNLLHCSDFEGPRFGNPNDNRNNLRIDNMVKSFSESFGVSTISVPVSPENFHGDGIFRNKDINVIDANRFLENNINTEFFKHFACKEFSPIDLTSLFSSYRSIELLFKRYLSSSHQQIGLSREFFSFAQRHIMEPDSIRFSPSPGLDSVVFEKFDNWGPACSELFGYFLDREFLIEESDNYFMIKPKVCMVDRRYKRESGRNKPGFDSIPFGYPGHPCNFGKIPVDHISFVKIENVQIIHVENLSVYDVSTLSTSYIVNGVLSSNCRCFMLPVTLSYKELGLNIPELEKVARPFTVVNGIPIDEGGKKRVLDFGMFQGNAREFIESKGPMFLKNMIGPNRKALIDAGKIGIGDLIDKNGNVVLLKDLGKATVSIKPPPEIIRIKGISEAAKAMAGFEVSAAQKAALKDYTSEGFNTINGHLRGMKKLSPETLSVVEKNMADLDEFLKTAPRVEAETYRGVTLNKKLFDEWKQLKKDSSFVDKGFMSTSYDRKIVKDFIGNSQYSAEMIVKSKNGVLVESLSDKKPEKEVLLSRNTKFIVESVKVKEKGVIGSILFTLVEK